MISLHRSIVRAEDFGKIMSPFLSDNICLSSNLEHRKPEVGTQNRQLVVIAIIYISSKLGRNDQIQLITYIHIDSNQIRS